MYIKKNFKFSKVHALNYEHDQTNFVGNHSLILNFRKENYDMSKK